MGIMEWLVITAWSVFLIRPPRECGDEYKRAVMTPTSLPSALFLLEQYSCFVLMDFLRTTDLTQPLDWNLYIMDHDPFPFLNNSFPVFLIDWISYKKHRSPVIHHIIQPKKYTNSQHHEPSATEIQSSVTTSTNVDMFPLVKRESMMMIPPWVKPSLVSFCSWLWGVVSFRSCGCSKQVSLILIRRGYYFGHE